MKRIILILTLFVFLSSSSLAESSAADEFMGNLSRTWGSFLNLAKETGDNVDSRHKRTPLYILIWYFSDDRIRFFAAVCKGLRAGFTNCFSFDSPVNFLTVRC